MAKCLQHYQAWRFTFSLSTTKRDVFCTLSTTKLNAFCILSTSKLNFFLKTILWLILTSYTYYLQLSFTPFCTLSTTTSKHNATCIHSFLHTKLFANCLPLRLTQFAYMCLAFCTLSTNKLNTVCILCFLHTNTKLKDICILSFLHTAFY